MALLSKMGRVFLLWPPSQKRQNPGICQAILICFHRNQSHDFSLPFLRTVMWQFRQKFLCFFSSSKNFHIFPIFLLTLKATFSSPFFSPIWRHQPEPLPEPRTIRQRRGKYWHVRDRLGHVLNMIVPVNVAGLPRKSSRSSLLQPPLWWADGMLNRLHTTDQEFAKIYSPSW